MTEKIYTTKKNGMAVLLLTILLLVGGIALLVFAINNSPLLFIPAGVILCLGWVPLCGLKILKPQEALVLTLFGEYKGTLKEEGFYYVNPFCTALNPAAATRLAQSGETAPAGHIAGIQVTAASAFP